MTSSELPASKENGLLCLCLTSATLNGNISILEEYGGYADILELRVDRLQPDERAPAAGLPASTRLPVILTIRRTREGGAFEGSEEERISLAMRLLSGGFSYIDVEEDLEAPLLEETAAAAGCRIIRSLHDTAGVPADLESRLLRLARSGREIPKAAVTPRGDADLARLLGVFESTRGLRKILLGMGEYGFCTRVLAGKLGSWLCYGSAPGGNAAPGHLDPRTLSGLYRFPMIAGDTEVFGLIGLPVAHSRSPLIHNKGFATLGMNAVYIPFPVDDVSAFLDCAEILGIRGLSVTIPHKQSVLPFLTLPDDLVKSVGACNTMIRLPEGKGWAGMNTDVEGFLSPLRDHFGGAVPSGLRATVIGAGGASRAVVSALKTVKADVLILNRTAEKARGLAGGYGTRWSLPDGEGMRLMEEYADIIVQATSVGMAPDPDQDPVPGYRFSGRELVYDLVYDPPETRLLSRARASGCPTISGRRMLLSQAFAQFRLFTGVPYPGNAAAAVEAAWENGG